ncbi:hypothetical protein [Streptomyces genisteinicus]|uniref:Uncharacterized protein n=1 Tax=Streptomyces genisteinicus TaxID=2768068 RepID=A0A7H0I5A8_9ACTN|nr:hypothetical protein [Streptomyces genisteinicus]QNP67974.1 hypothetical protein IAG43_33965 [Streptomyces genisteinicus]
MTEPTPPSWWKANRHKIYFVTGVVCGWLLCANLGPLNTPQDGEPRPGHTTPAPTPART